MKNSIGNDRITLVREIRKAARRAVLFSISDTDVIPRVLCWFSQIISRKPSGHRKPPTPVRIMRML